MPDSITNIINPTTEANIRRLDWAMNIEKFGGIVQGFDEINQSILTLLHTRKGSVPFYPELGSSIWNYIDYPTNQAGPLISLEIRKTIERWEQRVKITGIEYTFTNQTGDDSRTPSVMQFNIDWELVGGFVEGQAQLVLGLEATDNTVQFDDAIEETLTVDVLGSEDGKIITTEDGRAIQIS